MGKCVSKQPVAGLNEFGSSPYLAICNEDDIIYINVGQSESKKSSKKAAAAAGLETKGTAMSFGFMHKHKIHHAKGSSGGGGGGGDGTGPGSGTGTIKKATAAAAAAAAGTNGNHLEKEKATERDNATVISNPGVDGIFSDKNGNMGLASDDKSSATTGRSTPRLQPPKKDSHGAPYRNNRFGFRSTNVVRPASVGLQPKTIAADQHCDKQQHSNSNNNNNNIHTTNNNNVYITDKRRSKSASSAASARTTFTPVAPQQVPSSGGQHQERHFGALPKPQPKYHHAAAAGSVPKITPSEAPTTTSTTAAKGNMQQVMTKCDQPEHKNTNQQHNPPSFGNGSVDEHRPQSSVNNANGPTTRQSVSFAGGQQQQHVAANSLTKTAQEVVAAKFTLHSSSLPKPQYPVPISLPSTTAPPASYAMDAKGAKQAVNISRKGTLQRDRSGDRDEDASVDSSPNIRMPRQRLRNLEMVLSGRHKFEVRDLETLTAEPIVALPLPKLPSAFNTNGQQQQPVPLSGLVRSSELPRQLSDDIDINDNRYESEQLHEDNAAFERKDSITSSDVESLEEEKLMRDNNSSEKSLKGALIKETECSKTSSPGSSRASWCNAGETMATKDGCSSLSLSSSDEDNLIRRAAAAAANNRKAALLREEEDISSITVTAGNPSLMSSFSAAVPMDMSTNLDSISEAQNSFTEQDLNTMSDEPDNNNGFFRTEETKFAEMAAAVGDAILLDDETSPTDSLVSSCTESDDARKNRKKVAEGKVEKEKEKDIDEISPELEELTSPVTPGTPTHASNSLSLSDNGRDFLIDDEIADQPALLFDEPAHNDSSMIDLASIHLNLNEDTPTLKDSVSSANNNNRSASRNGAPVPKPRKIMSDVYESPAPLRKNRTRLSRAESLDTLSPCDSITSDDFMLDFNSSMDSINGPPRSNASGSASALHSMDELQLWSELENKGGQLMHEWSKLLRSQRNSNNNTSRESITSQLPARATRLLTRRLQNNATPTNCGGGTGTGSDSPRSMDSLPRRTAALSAAYKTATLNQFNNNANGLMSDSASTISNSAEDLSLLDKSLRNSMLQDVVHFKKQLVRLRRILQEDEENLMMTDTLNPFENNNGQFFTTATATNGGGGGATEGAIGGGGVGGPSSVDSKQQENTLIKESGVAALALLEDQRQELADLRRQVVYLQGEITAKDRTIRQQQNLIEKYEAEREKGLNGHSSGSADSADKQQPSIDTISTATQTERLRPLSFGGPEGLASRSEPPSPSHGPAATLRNGLRSPATNHHHLHQHHPPSHHNGHSSSNSGQSPSATSLALATPSSQPRSAASSSSFSLKSTTPKTQISSVYTQLSSIKHSTHNGGTATNGSTTTTMATMAHHKRSSLGASNGNLCSSSSSCNGSPNKTVRTTHIGNVLTSSKLNGNGVSGSPGSPTPPNGTKLLKTSVRTQSPRQPLVSTTPKRTSAIKPPSSFGASFTDSPPPPSSKSKSAPATPMVERVPVQIVIDAVEGEVAKEDSNNNRNGHNGTGCAEEDVLDAGEDKEHVAETEKEAKHNKINSLKLANGLTGCNDSSCKDSSLVN